MGKPKPAMAVMSKGSTRNGRCQPTGRWIRPEKRLAIYLRDDFLCVYCSRHLADAKPEDVTLDHLRCRTNGGQNHESNLVTACKICNSTRGVTPWKQFVLDRTNWWHGTRFSQSITHDAKGNVMRWLTGADIHVRHIDNVRRRSIKRYLKLARSIIEGREGSSDA